ncbi:lamin tail domain-containing protein [Microbacterium sp.]
MVINEATAAQLPDDPASDSVELLNIATFPVSVHDWTMTDDDPSHVFTFDAVSFAPGERVVLERDAADAFTFGLGGADGVFLYDAAGVEVDSTTWSDGDAPEGSSWGRNPDGTGDFETLTPATLGEEN